MGNKRHSNSSGSPPRARAGQSEQRGALQACIDEIRASIPLFGASRLVIAANGRQPEDIPLATSDDQLRMLLAGLSSPISVMVVTATSRPVPAFPGKTWEEMRGWIVIADGEDYRWLRLPANRMASLARVPAWVRFPNDDVLSRDEWNFLAGFAWNGYSIHGPGILLAAPATGPGQMPGVTYSTSGAAYAPDVWSLVESYDPRRSIVVSRNNGATAVILRTPPGYPYPPDSPVGARLAAGPLGPAAQTQDRLKADLEGRWQELAAFAWRAYEQVGRGLVLIQGDATAAPQFRTVDEAKRTPIGTHAGIVRLLETYDPAQTIIVQVETPAGGQIIPLSPPEGALAPPSCADTGNS